MNFSFIRFMAAGSQKDKATGGFPIIGLPASSTRYYSNIFAPPLTFFKDLGIVQEFARYRTPEDNCFIESWFKTVKYEKLYREELKDPLEVKEVVAGFIDYS